MAKEKQENELKTVVKADVLTDVTIEKEEKNLVSETTKKNGVSTLIEEF